MMLTYENIQRATAILVGIAFAGGEGSDPEQTLAAWRRKEGFDEAALERAARESAVESLAEVEQLISDGETFTADKLREYLERDYMTAAQVFWIARARHDAAQVQTPPTKVEVDV